MINLKQVDDFFSTTGKWWGQAEGKITSDDYERLAIIKRLAGPPPKRILELGSSYGNTAAVCAQAGYDVVGVELSDRLDFSQTYQKQKYPGSLKFIKEDFYHFVTPQPFDLVCYWNGFGIGTDEDLRRLLKKIAHEWLAPSGCALIDIQNPFVWNSWSGDTESKLADPEAGYPHNVREIIAFDQENNRFTDTWWITEKPEAKVSQTMRCFTPADFRLLAKDTGLTVSTIEPLKPTDHEYTVKLIPG